MCRIWFCPLLPQGSCPMLSRSSRPNFNSWSQRTAFCFDVQIHKTLQLGFRYIHSSASPSYNPHTLEYLKIWLENLCKFRTPSLATIMRGYKESLCLLPWDVHIFHHLTHQTVPEDFCKAHLRNQMQQESGGTFKTQAEDGQCPQSQLSDHSSGTRAYPRLLLPFLPGEAVQFVSRELTIYQTGEKAEAWARTNHTLGKEQKINR